jgi:hypothetical protein
MRCRADDRKKPRRAAHACLVLHDLHGHGEWCSCRSRTCHASCHGDGLSRRCLGTGACATVGCEQALYAGASALPQTSKWALENEGKRARRNQVGKLT